MMSLTHRIQVYRPIASQQFRFLVGAVCLLLLFPGAANAWEMEAGQTVLPVTTTGSAFQTVLFQSGFSEIPLVFVMPTMEGTEPTSIRVRDVSATGFELVQVEAPAADGPHEAMTVDWVAVTPGSHSLPDGTLVEAGLVSVSDIQHGTGPTDTESWHALTFSSTFTATPVVLAALQTMTNEEATIPEQASQPFLVVGVRNVATTGADIALERCEAAAGTVSAAEDVAYLAIEAGAAESFTDDAAATITYETAATTDTIKGVDNGCYLTSFNNTHSSTPLVIGHQNRHDGGDGGWLRRCTVDTVGVEFTIDEDTYRDTERSHTAEAAGFVAFSAPFFATFGGGPVVPTVAFAASTFSEDEEDTTYNLAVELSEAASNDVTVDFVTADLTATAGSDYTATSGQLIIIEGQLSGQIPISILEDSIFEGDEQFKVTLSNPQGATEGAIFETTGTIIEDDAEPQVSFSANDYVVDEADSVYPLNLTLSHASTTATSVDWTVTDTTTTQGLDYVETGGTVNFPALATSADIAFTIIDDADAEGDETAQLSFGIASGLIIGSPSTATLTITDNDSPATGWAMAAGAVLLPATTDGSAFQTIAFDQPFNEVPLVFAMPGSEGTDPASIRIKNATVAGFDAAQVESPNADGDHEALTMNWVAVTPGEHELPDGTLLEAGSVSTSAVQHGNDVVGTESWDGIAFTTSFSVAPIVLAQLQTMANETAAVPGEASQPWLVAAIRNVAATGVDVALERAEVAAGTVAVPETIAYLAIEAGAAESFDAIDASAVEYETFATVDSIVGWGNGSCVTSGFLNVYSVAPLPVGHQNRHDGGDGGWLRMCSLTATEAGFWIDEDQYRDTERSHTTEAAGVVVFSRPFHAVFGGPPATPTIQFELSSDIVSEDAGSITINVVLSAVAAGDVAVDYATADDSAVMLGDYQPKSDTLTIPQGQTGGSIVVDIVNDGTVESDETFFVNLTNPVGADAGTTMSITVTITDDDTPPLPVIEFAQATHSVNEGNGTVSLDVTLSAVAPTDVTIDYATADDTAVAGQDYTAETDTLTIPQGQITGMIDIDINDDGNAEGDETFLVNLANPVGATEGTILSATVTIVDNEPSTTTTMAYSVSTDTSDLLEGSVSITIISGVATFSGDTEEFSPKRGERLTYGTSDTSYIQDCTDSVTCTVLLADGSVPPDSGPVTVAGLYYEFPSIASALTGAASFLGTTDLVANDLVLEFVCYGGGTADTQAIDIDGWNTGPGNELIMQGALSERHAGKWTDWAYRLETSGAAACIRSTTGDLIIDGLQLYCTDDPATDVTGILLDGAAVTGTVSIFDSLIRLDGATGAGARLGVAAPAVGTLDLHSRNTIIWDLGSGTDRHAGFLLEDDSVTARLANATIDGGNHGIRQTAGTVVVTNTLAMNSTSTDFSGQFDPVSRNNASSDTTAPGSFAEHNVVSPFVNALAGTTADRHLTCDPFAAATITGVATGGDWAALFDGNPRTLTISDNVNPAWIQIEFVEPVTITATAINVSHANGHDWSVEMADSAADMASHSGSYRVIVPTQEARPIGLPDPNFMWDEATLAAPETGRVIRLEVLKLTDAYVHIGEWAFDFAATPCGSGADLSNDSVLPFASDIDARIRVAPWDIGADEATNPDIDSVRFTTEVWETEGNAVVQLELSQPTSTELDLAYTTVESSALAGIDFVSTSGTVTVPKGGSHALVTVAVIDDGVSDDWESFEVRFAPVGDDPESGSSASVRLRDDTVPVRAKMTTDRVSAAESVGSVTLGVELSQISGADAIIYWETNDVSAKMGLDYGAVQGSVTIPSGDLTGSFQVPIIDDSDSENAESLMVELFTATGVTLLSPTVCEIEILDDDVPTISLSSSTTSVDESSGVAQVVVVVSSVQTQNVSVDWAAEDGTALLGSDFTDAAGTVTVPANQASATFEIGIINDTDIETDETVALSLSNAVGIDLGEPSTGTLTIIDDDRLPEVSFASATASVVEASGSIDLTVVLNEATDVPVEVQVDTYDGSATAGIDYTAVSQILTIPAFQTSGAVSITIADDGVPEGDETFTVQLTSPSDATLGTPSIATVTILGDNSLPSLSFGSVTYSVNEHGGPAVLDVVLDEAPTTQVNVQVTSADDTAIAGEDYTAINEIVTFGIDETSKAVVVEITDDATYEPGEDFTVTLSTPTGANLGTPATATVTINPSDWPPFVFLADGGSYTASYAVNESMGNLVIPVRLSDPSAIEARIDYATTGETATAGDDFTAVSGTLVFAPYETEHVINIPILPDAIADDGETFRIALSNPVECTLDHLQPDDGIVTVYDDLEITFYQSSSTVAEDAGNVSLDVVLSQMLASDITVMFAATDGTAIAPEDFILSPSGLTFIAGEQVKPINVSITDDAIGESSEAFSVELRWPSGAPIGEPSSIEVTILDDETLEVRDLRVLHVEPDLVHIAWDSLPAESMEVFRRDADLQDSWQLLTTITTSDTFWRDFLPDRGVRHEYRVVLTYNGGLDTSEATVALAAPVPMGANEAVVTVNPGMASVVPGSGTTPAGAHLFAGTHDYVFTLLPDPGSTFVNCTVDVFIDEEPATPDFDEPSQPLVEPFGGRGRDGLSCKGAEGAKVIDAQLCDGATCDVTLSGLTPGVHRVRFVLTDDTGNTAERAIVQDFQPWNPTNYTEVTDSPTPFPLLFSSFVNTEQPSLTFQGPPTAGLADSLDCADAADGGQYHVSANIPIWIIDEYTLDPDPTGRALLSIPADKPWSDNETRTLASRWEEAREIGRNILKRDSATENWGGRQTVDSTLLFSTPVTVDLGLPADQSPVVAWVDSLVVNGDTATELEHTLWFRVEDHDQDVDVASVTVANLTHDGGATIHPAYYADPSGQIRPEGEFGWFVAAIPLLEGINALSIHVEDDTGHVVDETSYSVERLILVPGEYPEPVLSTPSEDSEFYPGYTMGVDAASSIVPTGFDVWLGILVDDNSYPMAPVTTTNQLTTSFQPLASDPKYRVRLVVAASVAMPSDTELRGDALPCSLYTSSLQCDAIEVELTPANAYPTNFEQAYALPEGVFLRWGGGGGTVERSDDGGQSWVTPVSQTEPNYVEDDTVVEGATYHYRISLGPSVHAYLGQTTLGPGTPVTIPVWAGTRIVPLLDDVTWHCPQYARRYFCDGTLHMRLQPEDGQSLAGATVRVFLNEDTFEMQNGNGDVLHPDFDTGGGFLDDFVGYDLPGCVVRNATPDHEVQVPIGEEEVAVDLDGILFGSNSLRFEIEMLNGDISERGILISVLDEPAQITTEVLYPHFVPLLFGTQVNTADVTFLGKGPAGRHSPDCVDGDSWYYFNHFNYDYNDALYFNKIYFAAEGERLIWTDRSGDWSSEYTGLADGTYDLQMRPALTSEWDEGSHGRVISRPGGGYSYGDLGFRVSSTDSSSTIGITVDSTIIDLEPALSHVFDELLIDSPATEETGTVRFRLTDADQNIDLATVQVYNCSIDTCDPGQPGQVPYQGFYAKYQWDATNGHYGWFLVDLPLSLANSGVNELRLCAEDVAGNPLGTVVEPCVSASVTRTSPAVFAIISDPPDAVFDVRPGAIVPVDGSASSFLGGVAFWTVGEQGTPGWPWTSTTFTPFASDPSELATNILVPTHSAYWRKARLVVAASEADLPVDIWPDDGSLPCQRSQGEGRCDSTEFVLDSNCNVDPQLAIVIRDLPTGPLNVGAEDPIQLQAHVTSPAYTFAYRWTVYHSADTMMRWPVATLGYGDAGEGFSLSNNDLTVTAAGQGLPPGDYLVKLEARYPDSGCTSPGWFLGSPGAFSLRVGHTIDGVAPGQVIEGGSFRVYSRTWTEGETGWVFIDEDTDPVGERIYSDFVQPGGFIQITPNPLDLPAMVSSWFVSVGTEEDGSGRSTQVNALQVRLAGSVASPLLVPAETGGDNETIHPIIPGETWLGTWDEAGDTDYFWFSAGAGTEVAVTLDRDDLTAPPQHPETPEPELFLARPDGVVAIAAEPLGLDDTGTSLSVTLTMDGAHIIAVRSSKGTGDYLLRMDVTAEAGTGVPEFGFTRSRTHLMTEGGLTPSPKTTIFDLFGNPITGSWVSWEQGVECGMGDFCGNGTVIRVRSSVDGHAVLVGQDPPDAVSDPMWRPSATLGQVSKNQPIERPGVAERLAHARSVQPILGVIQTSGRQVINADLPDLGTAKEITAKAQAGARAREEMTLKDGTFCTPQTATCPGDSVPVFHVAKLDLPIGHELVDLEVRIVENDPVSRPLDGSEVLINIPLALEIDAHMIDNGGQPYTDSSLIDEPVTVLLSEGVGGALSDGVNTCGHLETPPGDFTYWNAKEASLHFSHDEPDGSPCCYLSTELILASVSVYYVVDDGGGTMVPVSKEISTIAESKPRPADPCEIRPFPPGSYPDGIPQIAGRGPVNPANDTDTIHWIGSVYTTDQCGNINHPTTADPQVSIAGFSPVDPNLWVELVHDEYEWDWDMVLHSAYCSDPPCDNPDDTFYIPDGSYTVDLTINDATACDGGGSPAFSQTVFYGAQLPIIRLRWEQSGIEPYMPMVWPDSALRNPTTGEIMAWRVSPEAGITSFSDIPVKLYVARNWISLDDDGNITEFYEKVDDAKICVGQVHWHYDPDAYPDPSWNVTTTTCDPVDASETTVLTYSKPEWPSGAFDGYIGIAAGVTKVPDQPGSYFLMAEPLDEAFRRGDSWRLDQDYVLLPYYLYDGTYRKWFEVEEADEDDLSCSTCEECPVGAIGVRNGNTHHDDSDPIPGVPSEFSGRGYDSLNTETGAFGEGWSSAFDSAATTEASTSFFAGANQKTSTTSSGETVEKVRVTTEDNRNLVFVSTDGGDFVQILPQSTVPNQLKRSGSDLVLELVGDPYHRTFRGLDGKLETITNTSTGRAFTITFDGGTGMPTGILDSWKGVVATITSTGERITGISTPGGATATYDYGGDDTLDTVTVGSTPSRNYTYTANSELETVTNGAGYLIDSYAYSGGVALSAISAGNSILSVDWSPGRTEGETMATVVSTTGSTTYYYLQRIAGRQRVVEVAGDCSCSGNDRVYGYDPLGHKVLEQDAMGYITHHTYLGDGRMLSDEVGLRRPDCDPAAFPDPYVCRLSPDGLVGLLGTELTQTEGYGATWYSYDDSNWPNQPTQTCRYSTLQDGGAPRTTCRAMTFDTDTGQWLTSTVTGWTGQSAATAIEEARTTTRTLYDGVLTAAFDPGGSFSPAWVTMAQPSGKVQSIDGPRSDVVDETLLVYYPTDLSVPADLRGGLAAQRDPEGGITRYEDYDEWGHARRVIGPTGITTESTYDELGRVLTNTIVANAGCDPIDDPLCTANLVTTYAYEPDGGPLSTVTSPEGNVSHFEYDAYGRTLNKSRGPSAGDLRERMHSVFDFNTGLLTDSSTEGYDAGWVEHSQTAYQHTSSGQVEVVTRPRYDGDVTPSVEEYVYDAAGRIESLEDPNHDDPNTSYEYDPVGRLTAVKQLVDPLATGDDQFAITTYDYDIQGNLTSVTDANGNLTQYLVDDFGQTVLIVSPVTDATQLTYNSAGQVLTRTDSRGVTTTTVYDAAGRPTDVVSEDGVNPVETLTFDYNAAGRRELAQSPDVTETFTYDRRGAVLMVSSNREGTIYDTDYTYTLDGALDTITYPSGRVADYAHDFAGRPTGISVKAPGAGTFEPVASNIGYLPYGPAEHLEYGPAGTLLTEDRDFDWHYRRTHQRVVDNLSATRLDLDMGYDPAGNLTGITDTVGQRTANYGYDDLGRLTSADWGTGAQTRAYDYDDIGNLERIGVNESLSGDGEVLFGYDLNPSTSNSPVLSSVDTYEGVTLTSTHTVVTDSAGNISDDGQAGYEYTLRNHLEARTLGVEISSYTFSADGRRVGMTRGATTLDVVLGLGGRRLSRVLDGATRDYVWLGDTLVGYFDGTATEPVRVLTSHIGFPLMAVDATGTTVWEPMSEPYGELIGSFSKSADPGLRYPGQWQDEVEIEGSCVGDDCTMPGPLGGSVSLFENGFRWYRSAWGRYSQSDPIGERPVRASEVLARGSRWHRDRVALYTYVQNSPLRFTDVLGLCTCDDDCPSGIWKYNGNALSGGEGWMGIYFNIGVMGFKGEYQCVNKWNFKRGSPVKVGIICDVDQAYGFDAGIDFFEKSIGKGVEACNKEDLLKDVEGWVFAIPLFGFAKTGPEDGNRSWTGELSISVGLGAAKVSCEIREL